MRLSLAHVSFAHADAVPILSDASQIFDAGWHGIVGANGAGKTTLLRLLAGDLEPSAGAVAGSPCRSPGRVVPTAGRPAEW